MNRLVLEAVAAASGSCCQMLWMLVPTVSFEVASISGAALAAELLPPSQTAP